MKQALKIEDRESTIGLATVPPDDPRSSILDSRSSSLRAWFYLIWLSVQRQARARQMVWIALGLLAVSVTLVALNTAQDRWGMSQWRQPRRYGPTFAQWHTVLTVTRSAMPGSASLNAGQDAILGAYNAILDQSGLYVFSNFAVFSIFLSFLLPIWSLSFATEAFGGEREACSMVWLLTRPLPRSAIYLGKFIALLPWSLALNLGGFGLLCVVAGKPGALAFQLYWPAVLLGTLAFSSLFHLIGAYFRRPAIVAILYSFFLETILGNMPGYMKRVSISFYTRCMMFDMGQNYGVQPEKPTVYLSVDGTTSSSVLVALTVILLVVGMFLFARTEYADMT